MPEIGEKVTIGTLRALVKPECQIVFVDWQAKLNAAVASFPGFISLEILSSHEKKNEWMIVQRFNNEASLAGWRKSTHYKELIEDLQKLVVPFGITEEQAGASSIQTGITEVFVTEVNPDKVKAYRDWIAKIHQAEAKFPGFRGTYVQSPEVGQGKNWITLLQFDTPENLDHWLNSPERQQVIKESESLIESLERHRVISPYAGWFASIAKVGQIPAAWKQGMIVLLVLFPIVMLEMKYLNPLLKGLNSSLGTFIGNTLSVALVTWPLVPYAIKGLRWWLTPEGPNKTLATILGTLFVIGLYLIEIAVFWNLM
jgi:antibiotic biosynthesis monooxygenase (ABM) superfamily enzyme